MKLKLLASIVLINYGITYCQQQITGIVKGLNGPIVNASIYNLNDNSTTITDKDGQFSINATQGQRIRVSYVGKKNFTFKVTQFIRPLEIVLVDDEVYLDEVVLSKQKKRSSEKQKAREKKKIFGAFGKRRVSGIAPSDVLTQNEIRRFPPDIIALVQSMPGVRVLGNGGSARVVLRRPTSFGALRNAVIPVAWDIDGLVVRDIPTWIDVQLIEKLVLLKNLTQLNPYGTLGAGGVIIINTKNYVDPDSGLKAKITDKEKFDQPTVAFETVQTGSPKYISEYNKMTGNFERAYLEYENQRKTYGHLLDFYITSFDHFSKNFPDDFKPLAILNGIANTFPDNVEALRAMAYKLDEIGYFEASKDIYKNIATMAPTIQSVRDLAKAEARLNNLKLSENLYNGIIFKMHNIEQNATLKQLLKYERNLSALKLSNEDEAYTFVYEDQETNDIEILVEWNNQDAQFDLHFVNQDGYFHTWNHTISENAERINNEKVYGYSSERFFIDQLTDSWEINLSYKGNETLFPTYFKLTIRDSKSGEEKIKVYRLAAKNLSQKLAKINATGQLRFL
ncbi:carboxypeptidase-like regulatory domain-containing protein [Sungkyunkwania multivorans]|uniref:Carboxypeptidase-like regulatory domain-containing protein n=1 Tax=Sungkyunkwania multivorans TaxID=1173618 RepID=A0ABW3CWQ7_9FLAO